MAQSVVDRLEQSYGQQVKIVFRHFPLPNHNQAMSAALAAEAAGEQGEFWEMAAALYANQAQLGPELYERLATDMHLDLARFRADVQSEQLRARIRADYMEGQRRGVRGTPAFMVNGEITGNPIGAVQQALAAGIR